MGGETVQSGGCFNSRLREEATQFLAATGKQFAVSTHASVRRRQHTANNMPTQTPVSTHASVRRRPEPGRTCSSRCRFQLTPP